MQRSESRTSIPAEIKRKVLIEAGHRCAIPTCRHIEVELHHIVPWATCNSHEYENLIALCPNCHRRADRGEIDRKSLHVYKSNLRFAHDKFSQFELDVLFDLHSLPNAHGRPWPSYMNLLLKRVLDSDYVQISELNYGMAIGTSGGTIKTTPDAIAITQKGREFINSLSSKEL
jgi:HNH endonuclease